MANKINVSLFLDVSEFQRAIKGVEKTVSNFGRSLSNAGRELTQSITVPLGLAGAAAVKSFADFDKLRKGLTAMLGSSEAADAELKKLREVAKLPGLGFEEAVQGSVNLQAVGLSADHARETLKGFGAALAVTGGGKLELERVQRQLTQMISKNRILQEDFGILQENVPLVGKALENAFGTRNIEKIRATGISALEFNARLVDALQKLPEVQNATGGLGNAFENFSDSLKSSLAQFGQAINEAIDLEGIINKLSDAIQGAADWFSNLSKPMQKVIIISAAVVAAIGPILLIVGKLTSVFATALSGVRALAGGLAFLTSPISLIIAGIAAVVAGLVYAYNNFEGFRKVVQATGAAIAVAFKAIVAAGQVVWDKIKAGVMGVIEAFKVLGGALYEKIKPWIPAAGKVLGFLLKATGIVVSGVIAHFVGMVNSVISLFSEMGKVFHEVVSGMTKTFQLLKEGEFKKAFQSISDTPTVFQAFKRIGLAAADGYADGFTGVVSTVRDVTKAFEDELNATNKTFRRIGRSQAGLLDQTVQKSEDVAPEDNGVVKIPIIPKLETKGNQNSLRSLFVSVADSIRVEAFVKKAKQITDVSKKLQEDLGTNFKKASDAADERMTAARASLDNFNQGLTALLNEGVNNFVTGFAEGLGQLALAGGGIDAIFGNILGVIGSAMEQFGKLIIAAGIAALNLKVALKSFGSAAGAIVAGIALVALSKVVQAKASSIKLAKGGLAFGPTLATVGDNPNAANDPEVIAPLSKLNKIIGGQRPQEFILSGAFTANGQDLLLVLDRAKINRSRVR